MRIISVFVILGAAALAACGPTPQDDCRTCGGDRCIDFQTDPDNCGVCGNTCGVAQACVAGACEGDPNGTCEPGTMESCYDGPAGTAGTGICRTGMRTCLENGHWGGCFGQVLPQREVGGFCTNGLDDDCDGTADNGKDQDGDGWTTCGGDCCDAPDDGCQEPHKVNPGAIEVDGNTLDDDCDGTADNAVTETCDEGLASNASDPLHYARAMELCRTTTENDLRWGVISARFVMTNGNPMTANALSRQKSIRPAFGATAVQNGQSMVVMSTGNAAALNQTMPDYATFQSTTIGTSAAYPSDWYAANNNQLPNAPGCPPAISLFGQANDPVMLELRIRTPSNAASFSFRVNFMSAEFPEYVCTSFNDFFVVLLDSGWNGQPQNPPDKNLAFYTNPQGMRYPVGVNLAHGNTGLFTVCRNGPTGCEGTNTGKITTCTSADELVGTGMDLDTSGQTCRATPRDQVGGGTGWLTTSGNVRGGEIITLRIALWDTSDGQYDSVALIDDFQWSLDPSEPGTVIDVE